MLTINLTDEVIATLIHNAYTAYLEGLWTHGDACTLVLFEKLQDMPIKGEINITVFGKDVIITDSEDR